MCLLFQLCNLANLWHSNRYSKHLLEGNRWKHPHHFTQVLTWWTLIAWSQKWHHDARERKLSNVEIGDRCLISSFLPGFMRLVEPILVWKNTDGIEESLFSWVYTMLIVICKFFFQPLSFTNLSWVNATNVFLCVFSLPIILPGCWLHTHFARSFKWQYDASKKKLSPAGIRVVLLLHFSFFFFAFWQLVKSKTSFKKDN